MVSVPSRFAIGGTYLIYSEVSYVYASTIGYVLKNAITLSDVAYTRQPTCVWCGPSTTCTTY